MDVTAYTTYDDIRAALGVSVDELEDTTISLKVYSVGLEADLRDVSANLISDLEAVRSKLPGDRTSSESWLLDTASMFATYSVARQLTAALPLFALKEITDSKAAEARFAGNPFESTIRMIQAQFDVARDRLSTAYDQAKSTTTVTEVVSFLRVVRPARDPVLGT